MLKGEPVTWLRNVPDYKTMPWERLEKLFREHWHAKVRTTAAEARMQLHHGRHAMREHERIIVYNQRFRRLSALCPDMHEKDRILFYQTGLLPRLYSSCVVDSQGKEFECLDALMTWAVGQEHRLNAQRGARGRSTLPLAAARLQGTRAREEDLAEDGDVAMATPTKKQRMEPLQQQLAAVTPHKQQGSGRKPSPGKGKGPQSKGKGQQGKGKGGFAPRSERWKELCRKHKLCIRCGHSDHFVGDCPEPRDLPEPAYPPGAPSTSSGQH